MKIKKRVKTPLELFGTLKSQDIKELEKVHNEECEH